MRKSVGLSLPLTLAMLVASANAQARNNYPKPPESQDSSTIETTPAVPPVRHIDLAQLRKDADDLARTTQTISAEISNISQGKLPIDVIDKLKQVEKLSKRMRRELNP